VELGLPDKQRIMIYVSGTKLEQRGISVKKDPAAEQKPVETDKSEGTSAKPGEGSSSRQTDLASNGETIGAEDDLLQQAIKASLEQNQNKTVDVVVGDKTPSGEDEMPDLID